MTALISWCSASQKHKPFRLLKNLLLLLFCFFFPVKFSFSLQFFDSLTGQDNFPMWKLSKYEMKDSLHNFTIFLSLRNHQIVHTELQKTNINAYGSLSFLVSEDEIRTLQSELRNLFSSRFWTVLRKGTSGFQTNANLFILFIYFIFVCLFVCFFFYCKSTAYFHYLLFQVTKAYNFSFLNRKFTVNSNIGQLIFVKTNIKATYM